MSMSTATKLPRNPTELPYYGTTPTMAKEPSQSRGGHYNIIVMGGVNSGKSTMVEAIKRYANPKVMIDTKAIGTGLQSHTMDIQKTTIETNLPIYKIFRTSQNGQCEKVEGDCLDWMNTLGLDDYEEKISERKNLTIRPDNDNDNDNDNSKKTNHPLFTFNIYDTPGLNDTFGRDEAHMRKFFFLLNTIREIHLILFTVGSSPFTPDLRTAIQNYVDSFPELKDILAVIHTKIDYRSWHPENTAFVNQIGEKNLVLQRLLKLDSFQEFKIDCQLSNAWPIKDCITQNTINNILELATFNCPISVERAKMLKSNKMKDVDLCLKKKYKGLLKSVENKTHLQDNQQGGLLLKLYNSQASVHNLQADLQAVEDSIQALDTEDLVLLYEKHINQDWKVKSRSKEMELKFYSPECKIHKRVISVRHVEIFDEAGGEGSHHWSASFRRNSFLNGKLNVRLYATKANKFHREILELKAEREDLKQKLGEIFSYMDKNSGMFKSIGDVMREIMKNHREYSELLRITESEYVIPRMLDLLIQAGAYSGDVSESMKIVEGIYLDYIRKRVYRDTSYDQKGPSSPVSPTWSDSETNQDQKDYNGMAFSAWTDSERSQDRKDYSGMTFSSWPEKVKIPEEKKYIDTTFCSLSENEKNRDQKNQN